VKRSTVLRLAVLVLLVGTFNDARAQGTSGGAISPDANLQRLALGWSFVRRRNEKDYGITTPRGIDESRYVRIGSIDQYISIRGEDRDNPVILFLHGGPGATTNPWGYLAFSSWLRYFTVVQWDQRGAGRTFSKNGPAIASTMTIERMTEDGIELAEYLRMTLQKDKLILVGHSWGSELGVLIAKARPELFYAYVGTGQITDATRNYAVAYADLLRRAQTLGDQTAIKELRAIGPPPYPDLRGIIMQHKWANRYEHADLLLSAMLGAALTAPGYTLADINDQYAGMDFSDQYLTAQISKLDSKALGGQFAVPVLVVQGAEDLTTPTELAKNFVASIHAPRKEFVAIPGAGHFAVFLRPEEFLQVLVSRVRPIATRH
jgi:pimeloyl-ACP methyl ester carboxylesterase